MTSFIAVPKIGDIMLTSSDMSEIKSSRGNKASSLSSFPTNSISQMVTAAPNNQFAQMASVAFKIGPQHGAVASDLYSLAKKNKTIATSETRGVCWFIISPISGFQFAGVCTCARECMLCVCVCARVYLRELVYIWVYLGMATFVREHGCVYVRVCVYMCVYV